MSEFLFRISKTGIINQEYICKNNEQSNKVQSVHSFLSKKDFSQLVQTMENNKKELFNNKLTIDHKTHFLYIHQIGNQYLFYVNEVMDVTCVESIIELIKAFAKQYMVPDYDNKDEKNFLFDSIQKLNNDLINKQRETAKLNQELNRLNSILNNRLVKDPLTKLVSRYQYRDEILMLTNQYPDTYGLFWYIDIDNFKQVNDTYGHKVGDEFLKEVGKRLQQLPFDNSVKIRIAGDEFGLFIANITSISKHDIEQFYKQFSEKVIHPVVIDQEDFPFTCSVGISVYNKDSSELHELIDYADFAMYQAKDLGKNQFSLFDKTLYMKTHQ